MGQVVPLHNHSEYSVFDGLATVDEIVTRIQEIGSDHVALTDHGVVAGHLAFDKACRKANLHPIFGMEAYQARTKRTEKWTDEKVRNGRPKDDAFHLVLLAETDKGLRNLWRMSSLAHATGFYSRPRVDWDLLRENNSGIIATSACLGGMVAWDINHEQTANLQKYIDIFGDKFYIELHTYDTDYQKQINIELVSLAKKFGLPVVYATDAHYACADDYNNHEALITIQQHTTLDDPNRHSHPPSLWIQDETSIREALSYLPKSVVDEAIKNSVLIAEMCTARLPEKENHVPTYTHHEPTELTNKELLVQLVQEGAEAKGIQDREEYVERAASELKVIFGFPVLIDYFLIQYDITRYARAAGMLVGPGRGSVGGSLVAYLLNITDIDPLRYGLIFERFYNAGRAQGGLPDIDTDFPTDRRGELKDYIAEKYGSENAAAIGTQLRLHGRSAIDRVAPLFSIPFIDTKEMKRIVDSMTRSGLLASWEQVLENPEMEPYIQKYPEFIDMVGKFHGRIFAQGVHASGYLIANKSLYDSFPLKWNAQKAELSTQFDMHEAEEMGFLKNDFLGLTRLDTLEEFINILKAKGIEFPLDFHHQPDEYWEGHPMWDGLAAGMTIGVFQIENGYGARKMTKEIKPTSIEELAVLVSINRPGPNAEQYIERKGGEPWEHIDPILEDVLDETYGTFVFQEGIIKYMTKIGFTLGEADNVRKIMGKKKPAEMQALYPEYMEKACQHMDEEVAQEIWDAISKFAEYGFNKSHGVAYAVIALWTLYAKWSYPAEYMLACIRTDGDNKHLYVAEARRMGVDIIGPDINKASFETTLVDGAIVYGLKDVKGVVSGAEWVIENRPFDSYQDMLDRLEAQNTEFLKLRKEGKTEDGARSPKQRFGAGKIKALYNAGAFDSLEDRNISLSDRRAYELELLGCVISNPGPKMVDKYRDKLEEFCDRFVDVDEEGDYNLFGYISLVDPRDTSKGDRYYRLTLENGRDTIVFSAFSNVIRKYEHVLKEYMPVLVHVNKTPRGLNLVKARELK